MDARPLLWSVPAALQSPERALPVTVKGRETATRPPSPTSLIDLKDQA